MGIFPVLGDGTQEVNNKTFFVIHFINFPFKFSRMTFSMRTRMSESIEKEMGVC